LLPQRHPYVSWLLDLPLRDRSEVQTRRIRIRKPLRYSRLAYFNPCPVRHGVEGMHDPGRDGLNPPSKGRLIPNHLSGVPRVIRSEQPQGFFGTELGRAFPK